MSRLTRTGLPNPSRETKFSGANGDREIFIFPFQLTTSRIGNLIFRLTLILLNVITIHDTHVGSVESQVDSDLTILDVGFFLTKK